MEREPQGQHSLPLREVTEVLSPERMAERVVRERVGQQRRVPFLRIRCTSEVTAATVARAAMAQAGLAQSVARVKTKGLGPTLRKSRIFTILQREQALLGLT